jgi:Mn-dependent DtxR family transcriptional regulator
MLRRAGIVEHADYEGYRLTAAGGRLARAMKQLDSWAQALARRAPRSRNPDTITRR